MPASEFFGSVEKSYVGRERQPRNVYPIFVGGVGGIKPSSYVHDVDSLATFSINVLLLYQCKFISFGSQFTSILMGPLSSFNTESSHDKLVVFAGISGSIAKDGLQNKIIDKKLSNKLHVCVCVCVCV